MWESSLAAARTRKSNKDTVILDYNLGKRQIFISVAVTESISLNIRMLRECLLGQPCDESKLLLSGRCFSR